jgi:hypothetical protein
MLERNGFKVIGQYDMNGNDFVADKSLNILIVAQMKSGLQSTLTVDNGA